MRPHRTALLILRSEVMELSVRCKVCSCDLSPEKSERRKLQGNAAGIKGVYTALFDGLIEKYPGRSSSSIQSYLSAEPAFVCKSCFSVFKKFSELKADVQRLKANLWTAFAEAMTVYKRTAACRILLI